MSAGEVDAALTRLLQDSQGRLLAALIGQLRDFQLAEDCLQDACASAATHWARTGIPTNPTAWLLTTARRKAIDQLRRAKRFRDRAPDLALLARADEADAAEPPPDIPDERLRLIFTCCHPALEPKSRVALTLRTLGGLSTSEIARAFLDSDTAMGQRLSRAKAKIRAAAIAYEVPGPDAWAERLNSVLTVVYLIFNEGYAASDQGDTLLRTDLCDEAIHLARLLDALRPGEAEVLGLMALLLLTHARRAARTDAAGALIALDAQDRGVWDRAMIAEGQGALDRAMALHLPGPFQIKSAIAALHADAASHAATDWAQMVMLYDALLRMEPTPVVRLNRAVALASAGGLSHALAELAALDPDLGDYQPYQAALAELLSRAGRLEEARAAYAQAIALSRNRPERDFLAQRRAALV